MTPPHPTPEPRLHRLFTQGFTVMDIAEPLISYDAARASSEIQALMATRRLRVAGVRSDGIVTGYVTLEMEGKENADTAVPSVGDVTNVRDSRSRSLSKSLAATSIVTVGSSSSSSGSPPSG